ncbi:MAG: metal-dependent hydrolase, partial [Luteimonas sp.]|nr:metal-dependent hydrolase [Luteimonas sp.]
VCLMAHPLIDCFTVYGTQLLWPLPMQPLMWSSLFIIDPLFALPWVLACAIAWYARDRPLGRRALVAGIALGVGYVGWSLVAKSIVDREADRVLATMGLADAPRFSVPMPFNTLLWRVVAMTPGGYVEGFRSLAVDRGAMTFRGHTSNVQALAEAREVPAVQRLTWFNHGFMRVQVTNGELVLTDLRMGSEPGYVFRFAVARHDHRQAKDQRGAKWHSIPPRQLDMPREVGPMWDATWRRVWHAPGDAPAR